VTSLKPTVDEALDAVDGDVAVLMYRHVGAEVPMKRGRDLPRQVEISKIPPNAYAEPEWVEGEAPLFILYTSGSRRQAQGHSPPPRRLHGLD